MPLGSWSQTFLIFLLVLLVAGLVIGHLLKLSIRETFGNNVDALDRLVGAGFGAVRVGMIALIVLLVERLVGLTRVIRSR